MRFERGKDVKSSLNIGIRGIIKSLFDKKNLLFQDYIYDAMQTSSNWTYERRSWKKMPYYIIEVKNIKKDHDKAWAHYIPIAPEDPVSLFYIEQIKAVKFARERIERGWYFPIEV